MPTRSWAAGGWFGGIRVQVRQDFKWVDVKNAVFSAPYPGNEQADGQTCAIAFVEMFGDGVRIIGKPGGDDAFTAIRELEVYYSEK